MTLFDDNIPHNPDSSTSTLTEPVAGAPDDATAEISLPSAQRADDKPGSAGGDDFASALESFTTETEKTADEDKVIKGTVPSVPSRLGNRTLPACPHVRAARRDHQPAGRPGAAGCSTGRMVGVVCAGMVAHRPRGEAVQGPPIGRLSKPARRVRKSRFLHHDLASAESMGYAAQ